MKMDIATPSELVSFEQTMLGDTRLAYLTFLNESDNIITALSGRLLLLDEEGLPLEDHHIAFGDVAAMPYARFTCHLPLEGFADFASAAMLVEAVEFADSEPWALDPTRLREYDPPIPASPSDRNALVAIAGHDAVCFPVQQGGSWVCVCGRFNRWRWTSCRRCRRPRDKTLAEYTPENVRARYGTMLRGEAARPPQPGAPVPLAAPQPAAQPRGVPQGVRQSPAARGRVRTKAAPSPATAKEGGGFLRHVPAILIGLLLAATIAWGAHSLWAKLDAVDAPAAVSTFTPDYLTPIR